jgi:hypothetical protein
MERYEKLFEVVGWFGFALLTPIALHLFAVQPVARIMDTKLGFAGRFEFWVLLTFALVFLRIIFGGEHIILPLLLGFTGGFFLLALVARIGFMGWFWRPASRQFFLQNDRLTFVVGAGVLFAGLILSYFRRVALLAQLLLLILLPMLILLTVNFFTRI